MVLGYCEKDCMLCDMKAELNCPGCRMGPGNEMYGNCGIAVCCRRKGLENCGGCPRRIGCTELAVKDLLPRRRKTQYDARQAKARVMDRRGPFLGKWLWVLFWLTLLSAFVPYDSFAEGTQKFTAMLCISDVIVLAAATVVIVMAQEERTYLIPGCILAGLACHDFLMHLFTVNGEPPLLTVFTAMLTPYVRGIGAYLLLTAHAEAAADVDIGLREKLLRLRKWYLIAVIAFEVCNYIVIFAPVLVMTAAGMLGIALFVMEIMELVYLARMAKGFRKFRH